MSTQHNVAVKDDRENIAKVIQANQPKTKKFDPLNNSIQTNEVMDKTLSNYIEQIKTNIYIGKKAMYFVARDVYDAQQNLCDQDYNRLIERFKWNLSTESKILAIGASNNLFEVYREGNLPSNWTTLYELTQLTDNEFDKVRKLLEPDVSWNKIAKALGKKNTPNISWLLNFLNLEVDKRKVSSVAEFTNTLTQIKQDLKKYPAIKVADVEDKKGISKTKKVEKSIARYINSINKKKKKDKKVKQRESKRKAKEMKVAA